MKKNFVVIMAVLMLSIILGFMFKSSHDEAKETLYTIVDTSQAQFPQNVSATSPIPIEATKLYRDKKLIGIIHDENRLDTLFHEVYEQEYKDEFPDSKLDFVDDLIQVKEFTYHLYEDRDDEIFKYIHEENLFAIEVNKIEFSNGNIIYVKDMEDFTNARETFILNFISNEAYTKLKNDVPIEPLLNYGTREVGLSVDPERVTITRGLARKEAIFLDETAVLTFLSYGYNPEMETYTVQAYDTVAGVGWFYGMNASQMVSINGDQIKDEHQILPIGMELNVTRFNSPFSVTVTRERLTSEVVYPEDPILQSDPTLKEGIQVVDVEPVNGFANVLYQETYVNSDAQSSDRLSYEVIVEPTRSVVRYGTYVEPRVGSGNFRWPMHNAYVMCGFGCYSGHKGTDIAANGGNYGPIYPIDRGVVIRKSYDHYGWGYYVVIDHGNGYESLYAHLEAPSPWAIGTAVGFGDQIGYVGMTGRTTAPHVHLEVRYQGAILDACTVIGC